MCDDTDDTDDTGDPGSGDASYAVEPGIPMPNIVTTPVRYPWERMKVGESFFVPGKDSANMSSTANAAGVRLRRKFRVRAFVEKGVPGVRVWRVAGRTAAPPRQRGRTAGQNTEQKRRDAPAGRREGEPCRGE